MMDKRKMMLSMLCVVLVAGVANATFFEDWENSGSTHYPTGWSHTGGGNAGIVTSGAGVGGSKGMRLVGEGGAYDGYYRDVAAALPAGRAEFDFRIEDLAGTIQVCNIGDYDLSPRFDLLVNSTSANYFFIGGGYDNVDTGVALPGPGEWHHIVYEWYLDNSDMLIVNGTTVTIPAHWYHHRAYGGYPGTDQLIVGRFRFGVQSTGSVAVWDNINVVPEPCTLGLLVVGGVLAVRRKK